MDSVLKSYQADKIWYTTKMNLSINDYVYLGRYANTNNRTTVKYIISHLMNFEWDLQHAVTWRFLEISKPRAYRLDVISSWLGIARFSITQYNVGGGGGGGGAIWNLG